MLDFAGGGGFALPGPGSSPDETARSGMSGLSEKLPHLDQLERGFGRSLGHIPVYRGESAQNAAENLGAHAYAHNGGVVLGDRQDLRTVAEETSHVLQMERGAGPGGLTDPASPVEAEAGRAADTIAGGGRVGALTHGLGNSSISRSAKDGKPGVWDRLKAGARNWGSRIRSWFGANWQKIAKGIVTAALISVAQLLVPAGAPFMAAYVAKCGIAAIIAASVAGVDNYITQKKDHPGEPIDKSQLLKKVAVGFITGAIGAGTIGAAFGWLGQQVAQGTGSAAVGGLANYPGSIVGRGTAGPLAIAPRVEAGMDHVGKKMGAGKKEEDGKVDPGKALAMVKQQVEAEAAGQLGSADGAGQQAKADTDKEEEAAKQTQPAAVPAAPKVPGA